MKMEMYMKVIFIMICIMVMGIIDAMMGLNI